MLPVWIVLPRFRLAFSRTTIYNLTFLLRLSLASNVIFLQRQLKSLYFKFSMQTALHNIYQINPGSSVFRVCCGQKTEFGRFGFHPRYVKSICTFEPNLESVFIQWDSDFQISVYSFSPLTGEKRTEPEQFIHMKPIEIILCHRFLIPFCTVHGRVIMIK